MVHRSIVGEFKLGHKRPWHSVHLVSNMISNDTFNYFLIKKYLEGVFSKYFLRRQGFFFDSLSLKVDDKDVIAVIYLYKSKLNKSMKKFIFRIQKFYRRSRFIPRAKFRKTILHKNIFIKFMRQVDRVILLLRWLIRGKFLGIVFKRYAWDSIVSIVNTIFFWIGAGLDRIKFLKNRLKLFFVFKSIKRFISVVSSSIRKLLNMRSVKTSIRFIRERNISSQVLARYMAHRLAEGYPIHVVFGFVLKQLRRKYKRLKFNDLFGTSKANCLGYHFKLSGRLSRRLRAKVMIRRMGKLFISNHSWLPSYESVQVKTKYGTCGLRVWMLYRFPFRGGLSLMS